MSDSLLSYYIYADELLDKIINTTWIRIFPVILGTIVDEICIVTKLSMGFKTGMVEPVHVS